ncbi:o-succinylbenzoic acid (OSB) synthetase [Caldalkalibacillus thermarum TA2.A1]|uniref:o-succinylbenzoate synthase n=1 Tax=Caldalkalibacillus thermarum (strain TA2.A1) TaxID=986075 RepID=F5L496_CALTT|nr:o-succinylbenzoate synthase [Caldalkalibacillus thermarum]EGL83837.1 o-succinylbenzoic acid (OSB) synthetase [Caldalkalibacillus thermarum TA2.A1]QZT32487.1 o-succinylbenzoate synthase [Caldalkalibacillus thermarum TA2.A1]
MTHEINIHSVTLYRLRMALNAPFTTSFGTIAEKEFFVIEVQDEEGESGWGESVAFTSPWYNEETVKTNEHMLEDFLIPLLLEKTVRHPDEVSERFAPIRRNNMAKAALEGAVWDLYAKKQQLPLARALGGEKQEIEVGISLGIQKTVQDLLKQIDRYVQEGYKRIKVKIKPGWDVKVIREIRRHFPDTLLMADANSAYRLEDAEHLKALDEFNLMMIEQPLAHDDIVDHAKLQAQLETPICLDESIHSLEDAKKSIELGSCKMINVKIGRVGGLTEAKKIHDYCQVKNIPLWCGGMLEAGIGRAHNIALTTLSQFVLPGDTAASSRYWQKDIIEPEVTVHNGTIKVPDKPGIGYEVDRGQLEKYTVETKTYKQKL